MTGCARLEQAIGSALGNQTGKTVAQVLPPPKAKVVVVKQGGNFCPVMSKLGWPLRPTAAEVATASPETTRTLLATLQHGSKACNWTP